MKLMELTKPNQLFKFDCNLFMRGKGGDLDYESYGQRLQLICPVVTFFEWTPNPPQCGDLQSHGGGVIVQSARTLTN